MNTVPEAIVFELPSAPPGHYLRWMAYWRQVEQAMASRPALEHHASSVSAPFLRGEVAEFISSTLVTDVVRQASDAKRQGFDLVAPVVGGRPELMAATVDYLRRRGRWMDETISLELIGVEPLEPELITLRRETIHQLEHRLEEAGIAPISVPRGTEPAVTPSGA